MYGSNRPAEFDAILERLRCREILAILLVCRSFAPSVAEYVLKAASTSTPKLKASGG